MIFCFSPLFSSRPALVLQSWCLLAVASPVEATALMRMVMVLMMCHSDKLLHNNALANLVTSFTNSGGVSYVSCDA